MSAPVDDLIDAWHNGAGEGLDLHDYLGWTWEQYARWVETNVLPDLPPLPADRREGRLVTPTEVES